MKLPNPYRIKKSGSILLSALFLFILYSPPALSQCGTCNLTETSLTGASPIDHIPAGQTLCITQNFCLGYATESPFCSNPGTGQLVINGTLRICSGVTFKFDGVMSGSGKVEILSLGRMSLHGTYDCNLKMTAVDPTITSGTTTSTTIGGCSVPSCEAHFSNGYAPFGSIPYNPGYTVNNGSCTITGYPSNLIVLPLELLNWNASWQGQDVLLSWTTPGDDRGNTYEAEYSADGISWQDLSKIPGAGNGGEAQAYSYRVSRTFGAESFFRIKITDARGKYGYSPVKEVKTGEEGNGELFLGPNPVSTFIVLQSNGRLQNSILELFDMTGKAIFRVNSNPEGRYNLSGIAPGSYVLIVIGADGTRTVRKITKL